MKICHVDKMEEIKDHPKFEEIKKTIYIVSEKKNTRLLLKQLFMFTARPANVAIHMTFNLLNEVNTRG